MSDRKIVKKEHDLILAKNTWSELEGKLFATLIKELNPKNEDDFRMMNINIAELEKLWGVQLHIPKIKSTCNALMSKVYEIPEFNEQGKLKSYLYINLFHHIRYNLNQRTITFHFHEWMKPYILNFSKRYVKYNINNILSFKNKYSISFYEFFKYNNEFKKEPMKIEIMTLEYLREWLSLPKSYTVYNNLRLKILKKVELDLKKHSDIYMKFEPIKTNKKVTHIKFTYGKNLDKIERQESFFTDDELSTEYDKYIGLKYKDSQGDLVTIKQIVEVLKDTDYIKAIVFNEFAQANQEAKILKSALIKMK